MHKNFLKVASCLFLIGFSVSVFSQSKDSVEFSVQNASSHELYFKCENNVYSGDWIKEGKWVVELQGSINPRLQGYSCSIAFPNRGEKIVAAFDSHQFDRGQAYSSVSFIVERVDTETKCVPQTPFYRPVQVTFSLAVDGFFIKKNEAVCF